MVAAFLYSLLIDRWAWPTLVAAFCAGLLPILFCFKDKTAVQEKPSAQLTTSASVPNSARSKRESGSQAVQSASSASSSRSLNQNWETPAKTKEECTTDLDSLKDDDNPLHNRKLCAKLIKDKNGVIQKEVEKKNLASNTSDSSMQPFTSQMVPPNTKGTIRERHLQNRIFRPKAAANPNLNVQKTQDSREKIWSQPTRQDSKDSNRCSRLMTVNGPTEKTEFATVQSISAHDDRRKKKRENTTYTQSRMVTMPTERRTVEEASVKTQSSASL